MAVTKISVIVPIYNADKYLQECLDSITSQTLRDIEIICVNDGSTDLSPLVLQKAKDKDNRIKIIDKKNEGQGYARKVGLDSSLGDYIMFCDADDKYEHDKALEKIFNKIEEANTDIALFDISTWDGKTKTIVRNDKLPQKNIFTHNDINIFIFYHGCVNKIYRKSFLNKYNDWHFPKFASIDDVPFFIQVILRAKSICYLKENLYLYRTNNKNSISHAKITPKRIKEICLVMTDIIRILDKDDYLDRYKKEFIYYCISTLQNHCFNGYSNFTYFYEIQRLLVTLKPMIHPEIKRNPISGTPVYPYLDKNQIFFYKAAIRFSVENLWNYLNNKRLTELKQVIKKQDEYIRKKDQQVLQLAKKLEEMEHSTAYKIGGMIGSPFNLFKKKN